MDVEEVGRPLRDFLGVALLSAWVMNVCEQRGTGRSQLPEMSGLPGNGINWRVGRGRKVKGGFLRARQLVTRGRCFVEGKARDAQQNCEEEEGKNPWGSVRQQEPKGKRWSL